MEINKKFVDTHCHLDDSQFSEDLNEVIERAKAAGVTRIINFGGDFQTSTNAVNLTEYEGLFAGVGIHPEDIDDAISRANYTAELAELAQKNKVVAIGEIGLDYHWEKDTERRELQQKIFVEQLDIARQLNLPICVHNREAHGDTLKILKAEAKGLRGVLHCFSGSLEMAKEIWKMGWLIGVDGPLTFKNAAKLPDIVKAAPADMLLIETDAPYMAPPPYRGKRNEPAYVVEIAKKVAEVRGITLEEVAGITTQNAENLYNIGHGGQ